MLTIVNVILFANATHSTGLGHLIRSLNFIRYYVEDARVLVIGEITSPQFLTRFNDINFELIQAPISKFCRLQLVEFLSHLRNRNLIPQLILVDNPLIEFNIELELEFLSAKTVTFLDYPHRETGADFVISTNALDSRVENSFKRIMTNQSAKLYIGPEFFILDNSFYAKTIPDSFQPNRVAANFGASDPGNLMKRLLEIASQDIFRKINFDLVLGPLSNLEVPKSISWPENVRVSREYGNSVEFWSGSEVAIGSVGVSFLERMFLGVPTLAVPQSPEQLAEAQRFEELGQGLVLKHFFSGNLITASNEIFEYLTDAARIELIRARLITFRARHLESLKTLGEDFLGY